MANDGKSWLELQKERISKLNNRNSIVKNKEIKPFVLPEYFYHGTTTENLAAIKNSWSIGAVNVKTSSGYKQIKGFYTDLLDFAIKKCEDKARQIGGKPIVFRISLEGFEDLRGDGSLISKGFIVEREDGTKNAFSIKFIKIQANYYMSKSPISLDLFEIYDFDNNEDFEKVQ
jgi:hypothetical protein